MDPVLPVNASKTSSDDRSRVRYKGRSRDVSFEVSTRSSESKMSSIKNVIIIGAGGHLGPSLLSAFDGDSHFTVSVLARQSSQSNFPSHIKVHRVADSYPEAELVEAFRGQDAIISSLARAGMGHQYAIIDAAVKAGVKRYVPSDFGSDIRNDKAAELLPQYFAEKIKTNRYLREKEKDGLTWTAFATGPFFEMCVD